MGCFNDASVVGDFAVIPGVSDGITEDLLGPPCVFLGLFAEKWFWLEFGMRWSDCTERIIE